MVFDGLYSQYYWFAKHFTIFRVFAPVVIHIKLEAIYFNKNMTCVKLTTHMREYRNIQIYIYNITLNILKIEVLDTWRDIRRQL